MTATIEFSDDARHMLDGADELWIAEHGYLVDNPLIEQAERATEQLSENPDLGKRFRRARSERPEIRRFLLSAGYHLYYSVDDARTRVVILAVWYSGRGETPVL